MLYNVLRPIQIDSDHLGICKFIKARDVVSVSKSLGQSCWRTSYTQHFQIFSILQDPDLQPLNSVYLNSASSEEEVGLGLVLASRTYIHMAVPDGMTTYGKCPVV